MNVRSFCPSCNSCSLRICSSVQPQHLLRCSACGLVFESRIPSDDELAAHYAEYSYSMLKPCLPATKVSFRNVLRSFLPWEGKRRLLDLGCGQGDFMVDALASHWYPRGIEFSQAAVLLCRGRGLQVVQGDSAARAFTNNSFDVVTAFEVLEHVRSPGDLLTDASKVLVSGGLLYITTPNFNSLLRYLEGDLFEPVSYPDHLCFFSPISLRKFAAIHGFRVAALRTTGLDPWRLKDSLRIRLRQGISDPAVGALIRDARTELREEACSSRRVAIMKSLVNGMVNAVGVGDTLKAWLVKS
jgi:SAM-dependent methyltransferase